MHKKKLAGFSAVEALLIILIIAILGGIGWYVYKHRSTANSNNAGTPHVTDLGTPAPVNEWVGDTSNYDWNVASNWSLGVPKNGQDLVFNNAKVKRPSDDTIVYFNDNIPQLTIANITFEGSAANPTFEIKGDALSIANGIDEAITDTNKNDATPSVQFDNNLNLTANEKLVSGGTGYLIIGSGAATDTLNIGNHTIAFDASDSLPITVSSHIVGNGTLDFASGNANIGVGYYGTQNSSGTPLNQVYTNPDFTGKVILAKGDNTVLSGSQGFGSAAITIDNGATLGVAGVGSDSATLSNPITMAGNGVALPKNNGMPTNEGAISACLTTGDEGCDMNTHLTLSGQVTLSGYTELGYSNTCGGLGGAVCSPYNSTTNTYTFSKPVLGNYSLTAVPSSKVVIVKQ